MLHIKYLYTTISGFLYPQPSTHSELCCSPRPEKRESDHITPLFQALHWLLIKQSIRYKINTLCYRYITCAAPSNLCDLLQLSTPSRTLRSASDTLSLSDLSYQTFHCLFPRHFCLLFPRHFCLRSLYMEWPSLASLKKQNKKTPLWTPSNPTSKRFFFFFPKR